MTTATVTPQPGPLRGSSTSGVAAGAIAGLHPARPGGIGPHGWMYWEPSSAGDVATE
jgi:hypothetical protein